MGASGSDALTGTGYAENACSRRRSCMPATFSRALARKVADAQRKSLFQGVSADKRPAFLPQPAKVLAPASSAPRSALGLAAGE
jgi:hypothetical protein